MKRVCVPSRVWQIGSSCRKSSWKAWLQAREFERTTKIVPLEYLQRGFAQTDKDEMDGEQPERKRNRANDPVERNEVNKDDWDVNMQIRIFFVHLLRVSVRGRREFQDKPSTWREPP